MRNSSQTEGKAAAALETARAEPAARYDRYRVHLASSIVSDMFEDHAGCRFKDCRQAGRCLALDKYTGVCPMPLDLNRAMIFIGMIWFHDAIRAAEKAARHAREEAARKGPRGSLAPWAQSASTPSSSGLSRGSAIR